MNPSETSGQDGPTAVQVSRQANREAPRRPGRHQTRGEWNDYMREYQARRYEERRAAAVEAMGGRCVDCGDTERLQFDHVDRNSKALDIAKRLHGAPLEEIRGELAKCVLRCGPCHQIKTIRERGHRVNAPHLRDHLERIQQSAKPAASQPHRVPPMRSLELGSA